MDGRRQLWTAWAATGVQRARRASERRRARVGGWQLLGLVDSRKRPEEKKNEKRLTSL